MTMIGVFDILSRSPVVPSWSSVFVSTRIARSVFAGSSARGAVIPKFSRSCFVEALMPSGQTILVEVLGRRLLTSVSSPNAEQVASGSAF